MPYVQTLRGRAGRAGLTLCLCVVASLSHAIVKPPFDHRDYDQVILENGLEAILVSDEKARQGSFALEVGVGSFADPENLGGLAHLVEHAVLLGDAGQDDGKFRDFVSRNRGKQNGQTSYEFTRYEVSLDAQALPEALQRFGHLLEQPRFSVAGLSNEVKIVDEEFSLVKKKTLWRYRQTLTVVTDEHHPFRKFAAGNQESLGHLSPEQLHASATKFMKDYYAPHRMRLVVVGNQSLEELEQSVRASFGPIQATPAALPDAPPLLQPARLPAQLEIRTTGEASTLNLLFPLPEKAQLNNYKPVEYLKYVLDHQGPGSLQERLIKQGDIYQLSLGAGLNLGGQQTVSVALALTPQGVQRHDAVVAAIFAALATVREKALDSDLYESFRSLLAVQEFMPRKDSPRQLAMHLLKQRRDYAVHDVRRGEFVSAPFNAEQIGQFLTALNPDNALVILAHEKAKTSEFSERFNIAFGLHGIDDARLQQWRAVEPIADLALVAGANSLPQDLRVQHENNDAQPTLKYQTERVELWHAFNRMGDTPRTLFHLSLTAPDFGDSPEHRAMGELWLKAIEQRTESIEERVQKSGQSINVYSHNRGITLKVSAFRDQAVSITRQILDEVSKPLQPDEFMIAKSAALRDWANPKHKYAFEPLVDELKNMLIAKRWPADKMAKALDSQSFQQFESYRSKLWSEIELTALSFGQVDDKELDSMNLLLNQTVAQNAPEATPILTGQLAPIPLVHNMVDAAASVEALLDGERRLHQLPLASKENALVFYHQGDANNPREDAILQVLTPLLRNAYFEEVRGRRQLAYGVLVVPVNLMDTPGLSFIIQSNKADPALLTQVTDQFLDGFGQYLRELDPKVVQRLQNSLVSDLSLETTPAEDLADFFWRKVAGDQQKIAERTELADAIRSLKMDDLIAYVDTEMAGKQERSLILQGWNQAAWPPQNMLADVQSVAVTNSAGMVSTAPTASSLTATTTSNTGVTATSPATPKEATISGSRSL